MPHVPDPARKLALLRAAEEVFASVGVASATVEDIATKAGLSPSVFYVYFASPAIVLKHIVDGWLTGCAALFAGPQDYPDAGDDPDSLIDFCVERDTRIYEFFWQSRVTMRILRSCAGEYDYLFDSFRADLQRRNREWIDQWRRDGYVRPEVDADLAAALMSGAHEELSHKMIRSERRPPIERWVEFAQETFVRAFGTPEIIAAIERRDPRQVTGIHEVDPAPQSRTGAARETRETKTQSGT